MYLTFKIARGGHFHNGGHLSFLGEFDFQELVKRCANDLFFYEEDENGKPCKPYMTDCNGETMLKVDECFAKTGYLDFDGIYDTAYTTTDESLSEDELYAIARDIDWSASDELKEFIKPYQEEFGFDEN